MRYSEIERKKLTNSSWSIRAGEDSYHPNRLFFEGVLTRLDEPSDKAPSGSRGHRVILKSQAAQAALPGLIGMAVDFKIGWDGHDARQKVGIITEAEIVERDLKVKGYIYARDFSELEAEFQKHHEAMGMSYELADAHVVDMRSALWVLDRATFTGAAILFQHKAAYRKSSFFITNQVVKRSPRKPKRKVTPNVIPEVVRISYTPGLVPQGI